MAERAPEQQRADALAARVREHADPEFDDAAGRAEVQDGLQPQLIVEDTEDLLAGEVDTQNIGFDRRPARVGAEPQVGIAAEEREEVLEERRAMLGRQLAGIQLQRDILICINMLSYHAAMQHQWDPDCRRTAVARRRRLHGPPAR